MTDLTTNEWQSVLTEAGESPSVGTLAQTLAEGDMLGPDDLDAAEAAVESALDSGLLAEEGDGMFETVRLADTESAPARAESGPAGTADVSEDESDSAVDEVAARAAFADVVSFYHSHLDDTISDHTEDGEHPNRPTTAREYFTEVRGWSDETVESRLLGWAPPDHTDQLVAWLHDRGHSRDAMLATGLIGEDGSRLYTLWSGRYVLPYFDADGEPAYAIARCTGSKGGGGAGYDGHPRDFKKGKYAKIRHTDDAVPLSQPIYGLDTLQDRDSDTVVIAEGIADAITASEVGYPVLSPVAKEFKQEHYEPLVDALHAHDVARVTIVGDADDHWRGESSGSEDGPESIGGAADLSMADVPAGRTGALRTADGLRDRDEDLDVRVVTPPAPGDTASDLDEFVAQWNGDLGALLRSARPPEQVPGYDTVTSTDEPRDAFDNFDADEYDADAIAADETTDDVRDLFAAIDRLDAQRVAGRTIVDEWIDSQGTDERAFVPTWAPAGYSGTANFVNEDRWSDDGNRGGYGGPVAMAAIDAGLVSDQRCPDAVEGETWWQAVDHLRDLGFSIPEYHTSGDESEMPEGDPTEADVALDVSTAYRAADAVEPADLGDDVEPGLDTTQDGTAWLCPQTGVRLGVVRAAAVAAGIAPHGEATLDGDQYDRAYQYARRQWDAPLPEYVTSETATERWDVVEGALDALRFDHLDPDAVNSEITRSGDETRDDVRYRLNPAYRHSQSGESVIVFDDSGAIYDPDPQVDTTLGTLRFVALDAGLLSFSDLADDEYHLSGDTWQTAYEVARRDYGAPLPEWHGSDPNHTAVLPDADDLADETPGDDDRLDGAYEAVADEYATAASEPGADVLRVLPGLGKTEQVFRQARETPVFYAAPRRELMAEAVDRAAEHNASAYVLPTFGEISPPDEALAAAADAVREQGQDLLRDREELVKATNDRLPDGEVPTPDQMRDSLDDDRVELPRESCPVANGEYGTEWWLAVHTARRLAHRPQRLHTSGEALFGEAPPCTHDGDEECDCDYSEGWREAADPDAPYDVLIGHYTLAHVRTARTYIYRDTDGKGGETVRREPRAVALDEFPGEAFTREFGDEWRDHATWLAESLAHDVADFAAISERSLWNREPVRQWIDGDPADCHADLADHLDMAADLADTVATAEWLLDYRSSTLREADARDAVQQAAGVDDGATIATLAAVSTALGSVVERDAQAVDALRDDLQDILDTFGAVQRRLRETGHDSVADRTRHLRADLDHIGGHLGQLVTAATAALHGESVDAAEAGELRETAADALRGGRRGAETLALWSDAGPAHPLAHTLLAAAAAPASADESTVVNCDSFGWNEDSDGQTRAQRVEVGRDVVLADRDGAGATVSHPPAFDTEGVTNPVVGLDATGRRRLWETCLGREVEIRDIHGSFRERREFLREVYGLQVVQTTPDTLTYEGGLNGKNFDGDVQLVEEIAENHAADPAVVTTKSVETALEDRLSAAGAATTVHYGDLKGSERLADHRVAALLGCQHYGDSVIEQWAALAGEETARTGHGTDLDYQSPTANEMLGHMRADQVLQAILRFGRDTDGAVVYAHTAALRDDVPVTAEGEVVHTYSETAQRVAAAANRCRARITAAAVREEMDTDVSKRHVRRTLRDLADRGYLTERETGAGMANEFVDAQQTPQAETDLPSIEDPGQDDPHSTYTWSVRVLPGEARVADHRPRKSAVLPRPNGGDPAATKARR